MAQRLIAEDVLSLAIATAGSVAALVSVAVAWLVQRDVRRQRERDDLDAAIKEAVLVRWAANASDHAWGQPLENYRTVFQRVRRFTPDVDEAEKLFMYREPSTDPDRWQTEADEVALLAIEATRQLRQSLAHHK